MTEEKGSRLKGALGLDNLKGLGETLKQIKDVTESLDEIKKTIGEVAKDNNPISKALAQTIEAQGLKALNEDDRNVAEEVRRTLAEENKAQSDRIEELLEENKRLKEDRVISEVTETFKAEMDRRLPQPGGGNDGGQGKLMSALEDVVSDYMKNRLLGGDGTMTAEQIRSVIREEVAAVGGGIKKPEDMVEDLVNALTVGDKLREKLGIAGTGIGGRLLQEGGGNSGLRTDLVKVLLEDERERLKIMQDHETQMERNKHLGSLANTVKENFSDGIAALSAAAQEARAGTGSKPSEGKPQVFSCGDCGTQFSPPPGWAGQPLQCPNPQCRREYTKEELLA